MVWFKKYYYLIDKMNAPRAEVIKKTLDTVSSIKNSRVSASRGVVEVTAKRDVSEQVKMACDIAGARYRTSAKKHELPRE